MYRAIEEGEAMLETWSQTDYYWNPAFPTDMHSPHCAVDTAEASEICLI